MVVFFVEVSHGVFGLLLVVDVENRVFLCENYWSVVLWSEQVLFSYGAVRMLVLILQLVHDAALHGLHFCAVFGIVVSVFLLTRLP